MPSSRHRSESSSPCEKTVPAHHQFREVHDLVGSSRTPRQTLRERIDAEVPAQPVNLSISKSYKDCFSFSRLTNSGDFFSSLSLQKRKRPVYNAHPVAGNTVSRCGSRKPEPGSNAKPSWKGGRVVECGGLENRLARNPGHGGSNPPSSATLHAAGTGNRACFVFLHLLNAASI